MYDIYKSILTMKETLCKIISINKRDRHYLYAILFLMNIFVFFIFKFINVEKHEMFPAIQLIKAY